MAIHRMAGHRPKSEEAWWVSLMARLDEGRIGEIDIL